MGYIHLLFLAIIQGLTEFIPVSSSAHLAALPFFLDIQRQSIEIDIAVHLGSLLAVCQIFYHDFVKLLLGFFDIILGKYNTSKSNLFVLSLTATIPIIIATIFIIAFDLLNSLRDIKTVALACIIFSIPLYIAHKTSKKIYSFEHFGIWDAFYIGIWQSFAVIPGASRSGCCITGSLFRGFKNKAATHISLILSIPTILGSGMLLVVELIFVPKDQILSSNLTVIFLCIIFSYVAALLSIKIFFHYIEKITFLPFIIYRIFLGILILGFIFFPNLQT